MKKIILVPVHVWRVSYEVALGWRPTGIYALLLDAIRGGANEVTELEVLFALPKRILLEALVVLFERGLVALTAHNRLILTRPAESTQTVAIHTTWHSADLVQERVTGQLAREQWVRLRSRHAYRDRVHELPAGDLPAQLAPSQTQPFLFLPSFTENTGAGSRYLHSIQEAALVRAGSDVLAVAYDSDSGEFRNLPLQWRQALLPELSKVVSGWPSSLSSHPPQVPAEPQCYWQHKCSANPLTLREPPVLSDELAALDAGELLLLFTPDLRAGQLNKLQPAFLGALEKGAEIDIVWGNRPAERNFVALEAHNEALSLLENISRQAREQRWRGRLWVGAQPSDLRNSLILRQRNTMPPASETGSERLTCCFGTEPMLADSPPIGSSTPSGCAADLHSPGLLRKLLRILRDVVSRDEGLRPGTAVSRLAYAIDSLAYDESQEEQHTLLRLWQDRQHEGLRQRLPARPSGGAFRDNNWLLLTSYDFASPVPQPLPRNGFVTDLGIELELSSQQS